MRSTTESQTREALEHLDRSISRLLGLVGEQTSVTPRPVVCFLGLVLTSGCNLACSYCYQARTSVRTLAWPLVDAALKLVLRSGHPSPRISFFGGEPLLEAALIRRVVDEVARRRPAGVTPRYRVTTNGLLLDGPVSQLLAENDIETLISCDGREAQEIRAAGTADRLDEVVRGLRQRHPRFFERRVTIRITLSSQNLPLLWRSVAHLLDLGVVQIAITPIITYDAGWRVAMIDDLAEQLDRIRTLCGDDTLRSARPPIAAFGRSRRSRLLPRSPEPMCGAVDGGRLVVDPGGLCHGCSTWIDSMQNLPEGLLTDTLGKLRLGELTSPELADRLNGLPQAARRCQIFMSKEEKHSSYGECGSCFARSECLVCPISIGHIPGNRDPRRVPDLQCAFNRAVVAARHDLWDGWTPDEGRSTGS